ncbi:HK-domain-containing protein [Dendrothele bispora CBS 962.96]|uniref:HK-domain-containing protein n=1 Tax=Dendrothele bispora (strain CBS 962.96) TaxID=1314807 RepID=A0A4S8MRY4_DENBC|nr:HK-domain-containing protein [Dendrothele bispora CBS 962.96]
MLQTSIDYSLYLVTGRELLPQGKDYLQSLEESLEGGVTVVQIREKKAETAEFLDIASKSKDICARYNVPLLINDRIDIALAVGADGVHIGQTDMPVSIARKLLPKDSIIGVSCNTIEELEMAIKDGADYVGIGAVYATQTKDLVKPLVGVRGVGSMLRLLDGTSIKAVAIGGINLKNVLRTLHGTVSETGHALDGIAVVSAIVTSINPRQAAADLAEIIREFKKGPSLTRGLSISTNGYTVDTIINSITTLMKSIRILNPLIHQITNNVVTTQSANVTIALGASPIMATTADEMSDLAEICGALLVNIGTLTPPAYAGMLKAGFHVNALKKPVVFDPVGVGATEFRKKVVKDLLDKWQATVIKGNAGELAALVGSNEVASKGVDTAGEGFKDPVLFVKTLARRERCIIVLTGKTDYISDGHTCAILNNGHQFLGEITGSGCATGSCIASYCAVASLLARADRKMGAIPGQLVEGDMFVAAIAGLLVFNVAAEFAAVRGDVKGPGTFFPALVDELASLTPEKVVRRVKIQIV